MQNRGKMMTLTGICFLAFLALAGVLTVFVTALGNREPTPSLSVDKVVQVEDPSGEESRRVYILREYEKMVAVYAPGAEEPLEVTEIPADSLPYADQVKLREGLVVHGSEELAQVLEDFGS